MVPRGGPVPGGLHALGVKLEEVEGQLFDTGFGLRLRRLPSARAQLRHLRCGAFLARVLRDPVEGVDADVEHIAAFVGQPNGLLLLAVDIDFLQAAEFSDAVVDVHHEVAGLQGQQLLERQGLLVAFEAFFEAAAGFRSS